MAVRIEKILFTVLHKKAHGGQVTETVETFSEGAGRFYG